MTRSGHQPGLNLAAQQSSKVLSFRLEAREARAVKRREFISLLGGAAVAWPLAARAQPAKLPTIGFFSAGSAGPLSSWVGALVKRLRELGWIEGHTVAIEYRWAEGRNERLAEIAAEFVRLKVDVIITHSAAPVIAAKQTTAVIPIGFAVAADPLGTGLVANLARPGGNVTGLSSQTGDLAGKRLELFRELVPSLRRLAIIANVDAPGAVLEVADVQATARALGLEVATSEVRRAEDIVALCDAGRLTRNIWSAGPKKSGSAEVNSRFSGDRETIVAVSMKG